MKQPAEKRKLPPMIFVRDGGPMVARIDGGTVHGKAQRYPSQQADGRRAANRVSKKIAAALAGELGSKGRNAKKQKHDHEISGKDLVRLLKQQLAKRGPEAGRIRAALTKAGAS